MMMRLSVTATIVVSLVAGSAYAEAPSAWLQDQTENMHRITGPFVSRDYGFSVEAPPGVSGYVTNGDDANHGVIFILGDHRKIAAYPAYTGFVGGDDVPCSRQQYPWRDTGTVVHGSGEIGGLPACVVTFADRSTVWHLMQTNRDDRGTGIMYSFVLTTTPRYLHHDAIVFQKIADSFKRVPIFP